MTSKWELTDPELLIDHEVKVLGQILESKQRYRKVVQAVIAQWVKDFQSGRIRVNSVDDLNKLIEIDQRLQRYEL